MEVAPSTGIECLRTTADNVKLDHNHARYCSICHSLKQTRCTEKYFSKGGGLVYEKYNLSALIPREFITLSCSLDSAIVMGRKLIRLWPHLTTSDVMISHKRGSGAETVGVRVPGLSLEALSNQ